MSSASERSPINVAARACAADIQAILTAAERRKIALGEYYTSLQPTTEELRSIQSEVQRVKAYERDQMQRVVRRVELDAYRQWLLEQSKALPQQRSSYAAYRSGIEYAMQTLFESESAALKAEEEVKQDVSQRRLLSEARVNASSSSASPQLREQQQQQSYHSPPPRGYMSSHSQSQQQLASQPTIVASEPPVEKNPVLLVMKVDLGDNHEEKLIVRKNDEPGSVVSAFAARFSLPLAAHRELLKQVEAALEGSEA